MSQLSNKGRLIAIRAIAKSWRKNLLQHDLRESDPERYIKAIDVVLGLVEAVTMSETTEQLIEMGDSCVPEGIASPTDQVLLRLVRAVADVSSMSDDQLKGVE